MGVVETLCTVALAELKTQSRVIIAVSGPQGSGKTTATRAAAHTLARDHAVPTFAVSLDDFYKPFPELQALAQQGNPLLRHRGLPGTHDTDLVLAFVRRFLAGQPVAAPVFDKSLHSGAGDRAGETPLPADTRVVLIEGWMVGFRPVGTQDIARNHADISAAPLSVKPSAADLEQVDANLAAYLPIWRECRALVRIKPQSLSYVYDWRLRQEHELRRATGRGMSDAQVRQFVDQYMPAYMLYNKTLDSLPGTFEVVLDQNHHAVSTNTSTTSTSASTTPPRPADSDPASRG